MNIFGFEAHLFHSGLGNEVVKGKLYAEGQVVHFKSDAKTLAIPFAQVVVEMAEDDDRIYFRDKRFPHLRIFANAETILNEGQFDFARRQLEKAATRNEIIRRLKITAGVAMGCLIGGWLCVSAMGFMVRSLVAEVPPQWEQQIGDDQIAKMESDGVLLDDSNRVAKIKTLAAPLLRVIPGGTNFQFHIMKADSPNAFALPGGHIVVTSALLDMADDDELVGVLAHESAHITQRHYAQQIISSAGPLLIFKIFFHSRSGLLNLLGSASDLMVRRGFSQEYEFQADAIGWKYLVAANIDPRGMIGMFRKFKAYEGKEKSADILPQAFQSHPALDKRIARLEAQWKKLPRHSDFIELAPVDLREP